MSNVFHSGKGSTQEMKDLPAPRRIQTPAGLRLSIIMNDSEDKSIPPSPKSPKSLKVSSRPPRLSFVEDLSRVRVVEEEDLESTHKEPDSAKSAMTPRVYASSVMSENSEPLEKDDKRPRKAGLIAMSIAGKRKWIIFSIVALILVISLVVGLAIGLSSKTKISKTSQTPSSASSPTSSTTSPTSSVILSTPVSLAKDFPVGQYSLYTYLDTISTNCTSKPKTWTCSPGTIFNENQAGSLAIFPFTIAGSTGSYTIAPSGTSDVTSDLSFPPTALSLLDAGGNAERYTFRLNFDRAIETTLDGTKATCFFNGTSFTGTLYTKTAKDYPLAAQALPAGGAKEWPFAMKFEKSIFGGTNTPNCYRKDSGALIAMKGLTAQPVDSPCSCLYRNWRTPSPY